MTARGYKQYRKRIYENCFFCRGRVEEHFVTREYRWEGRLCFIEGVPIGVCSQCKVETITSEASEAINRIFQEKRTPVRFIRIPVYECELEGDEYAQNLLETIEFGIGLKFGSENIPSLMPRIRKINDITCLQIIKEALKHVQDISELEARIAEICRGFSETFS